jgi:hypothetical protein
MQAASALSNCLRDGGAAITAPGANPWVGSRKERTRDARLF